MTQGSPRRLILATALPLMLGNVFQQLYTLVDASVVGRGIGLQALAALGSADWFNWLFLSAVQGLAQGFAIPMAQAFGANDHKDLRRYVGSSVLLALVTGLMITVLSLLTLRPVLNLLKTPVDIQPIAISYLTVMFAALPVVMAYNLLAGILRSLGDGKSPLYAMISIPSPGFFTL
jgi:Na+-driven multidrug efflux pump